jgi:hypothetical protein
MDSCFRRNDEAQGMSIFPTGRMHPIWRFP